MHGHHLEWDISSSLMAPYFEVEPDNSHWRVLTIVALPALVGLALATQAWRRAGGAYSAKPFRRTRDVSGLSGCLAVIGDLSWCCFVQFDRSADLL